MVSIAGKLPVSLPQKHNLLVI